MKRLLMASAGLAVVGLALVVCVTDGRGQGQGYPFPGMSGGPSGPLNQPFLPTSPPLGEGRQPRTQIPEEWRMPHDDPGMNRDILVTDKQGAWMIFITNYTGPKAPSMAREMVAELRGNPDYKLPAFVFNYGEEEQRKELERVRQEIERRRENLRRQGLSADVPIRVPHMRIEVEVGVLVGGYKDFDAARRDLERIRKLKPLDPRRVKLPTWVVGEMPRTNGSSQSGSTPFGTPTPKLESVAANIFLRAMVVRNPSVLQDSPGNQNQLDIAVLERLNADESFSLLKCGKSYTLAVKHFVMPATVEQKGMGSFWQKIGLGGTKAPDIAKYNAHKLAELLRKGNWDAYVLHTRTVSYVTVGGFDTPNDPRLTTAQEELAKMSQRAGGIDPIQLYPVPKPMIVPH
jgi:hypothetical protein